MDGYRFATDVRSSVAFFPLYPLAVKGLTYLTGNVWIAGIALSNLAFLAALIVLFKLVQLKFNRAAARRTVFCISVFPAAFFFYAMYTESLYLLLVVSTFYSWERNRHGYAGLFGAMAALTRPTGILLLVAGLAKQLLEERRAHRSPRYLNILPLLAMPLALGAFLAFNWAAFGEPLAFLKSQEMGWSKQFSLIPGAFDDLSRLVRDGTILKPGTETLRLLDALSALAVLGVIIPIFKRLGPSYGLYALGSAVVPLNMTLEGFTRYASVIFPVFMVLGLWAPKRGIGAVLLGLSALLMAFMATMFARWYFVG